MPLIELDPPSSRPRGRNSRRPFECRLGLGHHAPGQLGLEHRLHHAERHADRGSCPAPPPASSSSTRVPGSSVSRAAQHAAGRSRADDHIVELAFAGALSSLRTLVCVAYNLYARESTATDKPWMGETAVNAQTPIENRMAAFRQRWDGKAGKMLIGGEWREAASGETFATEDPEHRREAGRRGQRRARRMSMPRWRRRARRSRARGSKVKPAERARADH